MTPPDAESAAALLRSLGWSVVAPVDPQAAIPEPEVGQVWRSPKPLVEPRTVVDTFWDDQRVVYTTPSGQSSMTADSWRAWRGSRERVRDAAPDWMGRSGALCGSDVVLFQRVLWSRRYSRDSASE